MSEEKQKVNETVQMIRWRMKHEKVRFRDELRIIPRWVWIFAVALVVIGQVVAEIVYLVDPKMGPVIAYFGAAAGFAVGFDLFLLFYAYINRDAKRRGMNATLWTLVALLTPYLIGVILYFIVREPMLYTCPQCGATVSARFNYCSNCKFNLRPTCPQCKREVHAEDTFCPYCSHELKAAVAG